MSGVWRSDLGRRYRLTDNGETIAVRLLSSKDLVRGEGLLIRRGNNLDAKYWHCVFKSDPRLRVRNLQWRAEIVDAQTLSVQFEAIRWDARGKVTNRIPYSDTWKKLSK